MLLIILVLLDSATITIGPVRVGGLPAWIVLVWVAGRSAIRSRRIKAAARRLRRSPLRGEP